MENVTIFINFPRLGDWTKFNIIAQWTDGKFTPTARYNPAEIPAEHMQTLQNAMASIRALGEPWTATSVAARLSSPADRGEEQETTEADAVALTVTARRDSDGATGVLTYEDYPALLIQTTEAIAAFNHFTQR